LLFGFAGVVAARLLSETAGAIYCMIIARRLVGLPVISQILNCWRSIVAVGVMTVVLNLCGPLFALGTSSLTQILSLAITGTIGAVTYCAALLLLWLAAGKPSGVEATAMRMIPHFWRRLRGSTLETEIS
jgi:PST family polysaccharide transporter